MVVNGSVVLFFWPLAAAACRPDKEHKGKGQSFYTHEDSKQKRIRVSSSSLRKGLHRYAGQMEAKKHRSFFAMQNTLLRFVIF
jgi:hypothetical protein